MMEKINAEIETEAITLEDILALPKSEQSCNGFAFYYIENVNTDAVVKDIYVEAGDGNAHCVVYDPDLDVIIDPVMAQFKDLPDVGAWDGDEHPYHDPIEEVREWTDRDEFESFYGDMGVENPFVF